jgi:hypothetical protein
VVEQPGNPRAYPPIGAVAPSRDVAGRPAPEWMICVPFVDGTLSMVVTIT